MSTSQSDRKPHPSKPKRPSKIKRFFKWLELRLATPEFIGGIYTALTLFFFMAATNTLAGWLYVISGAKPQRPLRPQRRKCTLGQPL